MPLGQGDHWTGCNWAGCNWVGSYWAGCHWAGSHWAECHWVRETTGQGATGSGRPLLIVLVTQQGLSVEQVDLSVLVSTLEKDLTTEDCWVQDVGGLWQFAFILCISQHTQHMVLGTDRQRTNSDTESVLFKHEVLLKSFDTSFKGCRKHMWIQTRSQHPGQAPESIAAVYVQPIQSQCT